MESNPIDYPNTNPGLIGHKLGLDGKTIEHLLNKFALEILDSDAQPNISTTYFLFSTYSPLVEKRVQFLKEYLCYRIMDLIGTSMSPRDVRAKIKSSKYCVTYLEELVSKFDDYRMKSVDIWRILNSFNISTPGTKYDFVQELNRHGLGEVYYNDLTIKYFSTDRSLHNLTISLMESVPSRFKSIDLIAKHWIGERFKLMGWKIPIIDYDGLIVNRAGTELDSPKKPSGLRADYWLRMRTKPEGVRGYLPLLPQYWNYTKDFIDYISVRIWGERVLNWIEWHLLRIPRLKHHRQISNLLDDYLLGRLCAIHDLTELIVDPLPGNTTKKRKYCWKVLLHDISLALINRVMTFWKSNSKLFQQSSIILDHSLLKEWYHQDHIYVIVTLIQACTRTNNQKGLDSEICPHIILEAWDKRLLVRPELKELL